MKINKLNDQQPDLEYLNDEECDHLNVSVCRWNDCNEVFTNKDKFNNQSTNQSFMQQR